METFDYLLAIELLRVLELFGTGKLVERKNGAQGQ